MASKRALYVEIIESIFLKYYKEGAREVAFQREDIVETANQLKVKLPKNLGDVVYSFRYRKGLPSTITEKAEPGYEWIILPRGRAKYKFLIVKEVKLLPNPSFANTKIPDATPGIVSRYSFNDEQALLAKIRYNRLIDIFTGVTCYSLQNHLRTTVTDMGQVETDEVYFGIDKQGVHYVIPIQAKGKKDKLGLVQIIQDFALCSEKFPNAVARPIAAQFIPDGTIVLFEFINTEEGIGIVSEKHYRLVDSSDLSPEEIEQYRKHSSP